MTASAFEEQIQTTTLKAAPITTLISAVNEVTESNVVGVIGGD